MKITRARLMCLIKEQLTGEYHRDAHYASDQSVLAAMGSAAAGTMSAIVAFTAPALAPVYALAGASILAAYTARLGEDTRVEVNKATAMASAKFFDNVLKRALTDVLGREKQKYLSYSAPSYGDIPNVDPDALSLNQIEREHAALMRGKPSEALLQRLTLSDVNRHYDDMMKSSASVEYASIPRIHKLKTELFDKVLK